MKQPQLLPTCTTITDMHHHHHHHKRHLHHHNHNHHYRHLNHHHHSETSIFTTTTLTTIGGTTTSTSTTTTTTYRTSTTNFTTTSRTSITTPTTTSTISSTTTSSTSTSTTNSTTTTTPTTSPTTSTSTSTTPTNTNTDFKPPPLCQFRPQIDRGATTSGGECGGFYYDAFYGELSLNEDHFKQIEAGAAKAVAEKQPFERIEVTRQQALDLFSDNRFKVEIINDLPEDKTITVYRCGPLVDLCRGPHLPNTSFVKAICCLKASSAYWRGDKTRESLQRVYGISYPDSKRLKVYLKQLEEAKKYDHRLLGAKQELFFFNHLSPGSCFFLPHGVRIYDKLMEFIRSEYRNRGYQEVRSPEIYNIQIWETSGHAANYKKNMFFCEIENQPFGLKPMNCPGHCLMFEHKVRSYRELPIRFAEFGVLHRNEASGALTGLTRVRRFQQDDAHIFCMESQVKDEVMGVLDFVDYVYGIFGFTFELKLSTRPENYLGDLETWDKAETALSEALNEFGLPWQLNEGDGAFYGPKIDISVSDALKRKFQCATLQLDFQLPLRFNLLYSSEDEARRERPVMLHRAILGSVERMFAILLEHYKGKWPFWLSPRQVVVCTVSRKSEAYAVKVHDQIHRAGFYVDIDKSDKTINKKVREAQLSQYNYILVVGEKDEDDKVVTVRIRDKNDHSPMTVEDLLKHFTEETEAFH
ncbi:hypothetical protein OROGR_008661 [Orobanche gracilis]